MSVDRVALTYHGSAPAAAGRKIYTIGRLPSGAASLTHSSNHFNTCSLTVWHPGCGTPGRHGWDSGHPHRLLRVRASGGPAGQLEPRRGVVLPLLHRNRRVDYRARRGAGQLPRVRTFTFSSPVATCASVDGSSPAALPRERRITTKTLVSSRGDFPQHNSVVPQIPHKKARFIAGFVARRLAGALLS